MNHQKFSEEQLPASLRSPVLSAMKSLQTPPSKKSVWIGPFDQLASAAYALLEADKLNVAKRIANSDDYYKRVFCHVTSLVSEYADSRHCTDSPALNTYLSVIYFNAGYQRVTFAAERLVTTFAAIRCTCNLPPDVTKKNGKWYFNQSKKAAKNRLEHPHFSTQIPAFKQLLQQFDNWDGSTFKSDKALAILREQVNPKKHSVYDRSDVEKSRPRMPCGSPWTVDDQISLVAGAFQLVCKAYNELLQWNPAGALS